MATTKLGLPTVTSNMSADVPRDLNALAEAVDAKVGVSSGLATLGTDGILLQTQRPPIPVVNDGTTSQKGIVQLNDATNSTLTTQAATANAVKKAFDRAEAAFQSASDGKTRIANATGAPSVPSDTFTKIASDITTGKAKIGASIRGKGGTVNDADSLEVMAGAIGGITLGKKWASGTATSTTNTKVYKQAGTTNTSTINYLLTVTGLSFKPRTVIISWDNSFLCVYSRDILFGTGPLYEFNTIYTNTTNTMSSNRTMHGLSVDYADVTDGSFTLPVNSSTTYKWIAYE